MRKIKNRYNKTYTKKLTRNVLFIGVINGTMPYILSMMDKDPCVELGQVWVMGIVAVCLGYFVRGFKDTKEIADNDYKYALLERGIYYDGYEQNSGNSVYDEYKHNITD